MRSPPDRLPDAAALFLDFDGTLADLAPRPDAVKVDPGLRPALERLQAMLGGALALVSGRAQDDLDPYLAPLRLPTAFEHGAVRRCADQTLSEAPQPPLESALLAARALVSLHPGLIMEQKSHSVALHYRLAPSLESLCRDHMGRAIANEDSLQLLLGKAVVEVKSVAVNKGEAIAAFLQEAPFQGRVPVFAGDDVTDEAGFRRVQQLGGIGIKVGDGPSCATHRMADPHALRQWLHKLSRDCHP
ncbi:MAG TPA: trehalose-phosphatase [Hydrogenophaga sp.]|uniref:trehalose-phosphatase n=1 Tax=Hydrogenophaga sp. TaxID=1904254 RepID=UPI002C1A69F6|nr:trehalose-phosphatase [Hydrogenophaga sp.]HMN94138.1 trehalose-phosphatase [Hydrogenophaga sp.]HMP09048.1 trehalose-phosphatase [Hydrogenophaga sp.]